MTQADIEQLKHQLQQASGINFTTENSVYGSIPFLDILVKQMDKSFNTEVYVRAKNPGYCFNGRS